MSTIRAGFVLLLVLASVGPAGDFERGNEALEKKDLDKATIYFTAHIRDHPNDPRGFAGRGSAYAGKKDHVKALKDFTEAIRLGFKHPAVFYNRGTAYFNRKDYDRAIEDYSAAIRLDPTKSGLAFYSRGLAYQAKKEYRKALDDLTEAIRLTPGYAPAFTSRGLIYRQEREYGKAIRDFSEALRLDPKDVSSHRVLAWMLATCPKDKLRDGKRAVELATKACSLTGWNDMYCLETLAAAYAECGDFKEAVKWQAKANDLEIKESFERVRRRRLYEQGKPYRDE